MSNKPNNFPREGMHQPVTRDAIKSIERDRPVLDAQVQYTISGSVEAEVHSTLNAEREAAITNGYRRLTKKSVELNDNFQSAKPNARTEYIRIQREAARGVPGHQKSHLKPPSR